MIREITTNVVDCDHPDCDERYADRVFVRAQAIEAFALRDGWTRNADHSVHYCPMHSAEPTRMPALARAA